MDIRVWASYCGSGSTRRVETKAESQQRRLKWEEHKAGGRGVWILKRNGCAWVFGVSMFVSSCLRQGEDAHRCTEDRNHCWPDARHLWLHRGIGASQRQTRQTIASRCDARPSCTRRASHIDCACWCGCSDHHRTPTDISTVSTSTSTSTSAVPTAISTTPLGSLGIDRTRNERRRLLQRLKLVAHRRRQRRDIERARSVGGAALIRNGRIELRRGHGDGRAITTNAPNQRQNG